MKWRSHTACCCHSSWTATHLCHVLLLSTKTGKVAVTTHRKGGKRTWGVLGLGERSSWYQRTYEVICMTFVIMEGLHPLEKECLKKLMKKGMIEVLRKRNWKAVMRWEWDLREKNPCSNMLVIPSKCIVRIISPKGLAIYLNVAQEGGVPGGFVQPCSTPQQLILQ